MKKFFCILMALFTILTFVSCNNSEKGKDSSKNNSKTQSTDNGSQVTPIHNILSSILPSKRTTYEFSPKTSLAFFGREPEDFFDTYYDYYDECEDFRKKAQINEKGNLVLHLTKEQEEAFLQSRDSQIEELKQINGIYVSDDYSLLTITGNRQEVADIIGNKLPLLTIFDLANRQLIINKVNPEEIAVEVKVIDKNTGDCLYSAIWPREGVRLSVKDWQFSE